MPKPDRAEWHFSTGGSEPVRYQSSAAGIRTWFTEAVALGLKQLQRNEWVENIAGGLNEVCVSVKSVHVEHRVRMAEFTKWLERTGGSPADLTRRRKVREILDLPNSF